MKNNKKVMTGALLLFMLLAANFHNALNDYGIRSNAFMNGVIASGSNGSGTDSFFDNWDAWFPPCGYIYRSVCVGLDQNGWVWDFRGGEASQRECLDGWGVCCWNDPECCLSRTFGLCNDNYPIN